MSEELSREIGRQVREIADRCRKPAYVILGGPQAAGLSDIVRYRQMPAVIVPSFDGVCVIAEPVKEPRRE